MSLSKLRSDLEPESRPVITSATALYSDLRDADSALLACFTEMARSTSHPEGDKYEYTNARFKISQASRARRALVRRICEYLRVRVRDADAQAIQKLEKEQCEVVRRSTEHVSRWSSQDICRDWRGYCIASREIREHMLANVESERLILYPMLERCSRP